MDHLSNFFSSSIRRKRRKERFYYFTISNDHTKRHIPSVTTKTHTNTQTYVRTHAHAQSRVHTPPDARTYPGRHTHTCARRYKRSAYTVSRPYLLKYTNLKSTSNVFQLAPLTQIINTDTPSFITTTDAKLNPK